MDFSLCSDPLDSALRSEDRLQLHHILQRHKADPPVAPAFCIGTQNTVAGKTAGARGTSIATLLEAGAILIREVAEHVILRSMAEVIRLLFPDSIPDGIDPIGTVMEVG